MTHKPSIAILHYSAPPVIGGVEATIGAHARLLSARGYPVKLIAGRGESEDSQVGLDLIPLVDSRHESILRVNRLLACGHVTDDFASLVSALHSQLLLALAGSDVCIAHNILTLHKNLPLTAALHKIAQAGRPRLIGWCHDFAWTDPIYTGDLCAGEPWDLLRQRWPGVDYVVVSKSRRHELAKLLGMSPEEIRVIPPGLDFAEFLGIGERGRQWVKELSLDSAAPLLLLPARVTRRKKIERAIEITAALWDCGMTPKLLVMGPLGPHNPANASYLDELSKLRDDLGLSDSVIFLNRFGPVDDATRRDLYLLADALLFTSEREGFGIPVLEAGAARLPVFCSDLPPFHESAGPWARYFSSDESAEQIARRMSRFFEDDAAYQLKQRVRREYAWPRLVTERIEPLLGV